MSSTSRETGPASQGRVSSVIENKQLGLARRSTPDSEALLSSDDDHDPNPSMSRSVQSVKSVPAQRPARRGSWLSEVRTAQRKYSLGGMSHTSTNGNSQPPTPSAENGHSSDKPQGQSQPALASGYGWDSLPHRTSTVASSLWKTSSQTSSSSWTRKEGSRWSEVLTTSAFNSPLMEDLRSPKTVVASESHPHISNSGFPFDIPLEPSRKTIRSQSYSAGQGELALNPDAINSSRFKSKRAIPPSLARRKSRAAMEAGADSDLAAVQEDLEMPTIHDGVYNLNSSPFSERARLNARHPSTISLDNAELTRSMSYPLAEPNYDNNSEHYPASTASENSRPHRSSISNVSQHERVISDEGNLAQRSMYAQNQPGQSAYHYTTLDQAWAGEKSQGEYPDSRSYHQMLPGFDQTLPSYPQAPTAHSQMLQPYEYSLQPGMQQLPSNGQSYPAGHAMMQGQRAGGAGYGPLPESMPENVVTQSIQSAAIEAQNILAEGEQAAHMPDMDALSRHRSTKRNDRFDHAYSAFPQPGQQHDLPPTSTDASPRTGFNAQNPPAAFTSSPKQGFSPRSRYEHQGEPNAQFDGKSLGYLKSPHERAILQLSGLDPHIHLVTSNTKADNCTAFDRNLSSPVEIAGPLNTGSQHKPNMSMTRNLYLVTFKASRAEVFYRPAGFVGELLEGHMVIVEGDRGLDMGMIAHVELDHDQAKSLKADYNRKHYQTLVRFSRNYPHLADSIVNDPDYEERAAQNLADQSLGALGALSSRSSNLTPKAIRRVATEREIMLLRDKEGNEARAKRICQGKVNTQHLSMEILDAEFQLDYRKLTFYFYAEEYIPFNAIVTDLFKVWKTRIWLSAVNPDTYPAPPRRPGDVGRQPRRDGRGNDGRRDQSYQAAASAARRAYIRGAQDLAMGQFPGSLAATFQQNPYQQSQQQPQQQQQHQQQQQEAAFPPSGPVTLPRGPFLGNGRQAHTGLTFGSLPPPINNKSGQIWSANPSAAPFTGQSLANASMSTQSLLRSAPTVADALASRGELPPAFVPGGQQHNLPGLGNLSLSNRSHHHQT